MAAVLVALLVAGGGLAATGVARTDAGPAATGVSELEMDATLDGETVTVTVTDDGAPVGNASLVVEGDETVATTTDANGTAVVDRAALTEGDESLDALEVEYESGGVQGTLEFVVQDGSLTLVEETYEYEVGDANGEDADD
ncbi:MAG: hypothetical protein ABEH47_04200, partial [Haloferacaceae archaeon]